MATITPWTSVIGGTANPANNLNFGGNGAKVGSDGSYYTYISSTASSGNMDFMNTSGTQYASHTFTAFSTGIVKYNSQGMIQWVVRATSSSSGTNYFTSLELDSSDNVYLTGFFDATLTITDAAGTGSIIISKPANAGTNYSPIIKLNSAGILQFGFVPVRGGSAFESLTYCLKTVGTDLYAVIMVSGSTPALYSNTGTSPFRSLTSDVGRETPVLAKFNSTGVCQYAFQLFNSTFDHSRMHGIDIDAAGNIYINGVLRNNRTYIINDISGTISEKASIHRAISTAATDGVILCYNSSGVAQWAVSMTAIGTNDVGRSLVANSSGAFAAFQTNSGTGAVTVTRQTSSGTTTLATLSPSSYFSYVIVNITAAGAWGGYMACIPDATGKIFSGQIYEGPNDSLFVSFGCNNDCKFYDISGSSTSLALGTGNSVTSGIIRLTSAGRYLTHRIVQGTNQFLSEAMAPHVAVGTNGNTFMTVPLGQPTTNCISLAGKVLSIVFKLSSLTGNWQRLIDFNNGGTGAYLFIAPTFNSNGTFRMGLKLGGTEVNFTTTSAIFNTTSTYIVNVFFDTSNVSVSVGTVSGSTITYLDINGVGNKTASLTYLAANGSVAITRENALVQFSRTFFGFSTFGTGDGYLNATYYKISSITPANNTTYYTNTNLSTFTNMALSNTFTTGASGRRYIFNNGTSTISVMARATTTVDASGIAISSTNSAYFDSMAEPLTILDTSGSTVVSQGPSAGLVRHIGTYGTMVVGMSILVAPSAITDLSVNITSQTTATLLWTAPDNGGATITGYNVYSGSTLLSGATTPAVSVSGTSATLTGCVVGQPYSLTVRAVNSAGTATASNAVSLMTGVPTTLPAGAVLWFDAADTSTITASSNNVTTWNNKGSRSTNHFTSGTGVTTNVATIAGKNVLRHATNGSLRLDTAGYGNNFTILTAWNVTALPNGGYVTSINTWDANGQSFAVDKNASGIVTMGTAKAGVVVTTTATIPDPVGSTSILTQVVSSNTANNLARYNGTTYALGTNIAMSGSATGTLAFFSKGTNAPWNTSSYDAAETIVYATDLSTAQVQQAEGYLAWKWGTQSTLPASHPYRTATVLPTLRNIASSVASSTSITLTWDLSQNLIGNINSYTITTKKVSDGSTVSTNTITGLNVSSETGRTYTVTGLTAGVAYTFEVTGTNIYGTGAVVSTSATTAGPPDAPSSVSYTVDSTSGDISLNWAAPANNGSTIESYNVYSSPSTGLSITISGTSARITGATMGTAYSFTVSAVNGVNEGPQSSPLSVTPTRKPSTQSAPTAVNGNKIVQLRWSAPADIGASSITGYTIAATKNGVSAGTTSAGATDLSKNIDVSNGATYTFTIAATNSAGLTSSYSAASNSVIPNALPTGTVQIIDYTSGSQFDVGATLGNNASLMTISDEDEISGGFSYQWQVADTSGGTYSNIASATSATYVPIAAHIGKYYTVVVSYRDRNNILENVTSVYAGPVRARRPYAPTGCTATLDVSSVRVSWVAPTNDGGSPITSYRITSSPGEITKDVSSSDLSGVVTGLTAGVSYTFTVQAINAVTPNGVGDSSNVTSPAVTPYTTPGTPTGMTAVANYTNISGSYITVSWSTPALDGSSNITEYRITDGVGTNTDISAGALSSWSYVFTGLTAGTTYTYTVKAKNAAGYSVTGATESDLAFAPPSAPRDVSANASYDNGSQITISWLAPLSDGSNNIILYTITDIDRGTVADVSRNTYSYVNTDLTAGLTYRYTVVAKNDAGYGTVSSVATVTAIAPPGSFSITDVSAGNARATLTWGAAATNGSPLEYYRITPFSSGISGETIDVSGDQTSGTITGLTNGTSYTFTVTAKNAAGSTVTAASNPAVTPYTVPGQPAAPTVTDVSNAQVTLQWSDVSNNGSALTKYTITPSPNGVPMDVSGNQTSGTITGLTNGISYTFTVTATNAAGPGLASAASSPEVIPYTVPGQPAAPTVTDVSNAQVTLQWSDVSNNGSALTKYTITPSPNGVPMDVSGNQTSGTITGLTNGTAYTFTVTATNAAGPGLASVASSPEVIPYTVPGQPARPTAVAGNRNATVTWSSDISANGSAITKVRVTASPGGSYKDLSANAVSTLMDLSNGVSYTFTITAYNLAGPTTSDASLPVMPDAPPIGSITIIDRDEGLPGNKYGVGHVLATSNGIADEDGVSGEFSYQWQIDTSSGTFANIAGATGDSYTILAANIGKYFRVLASYRDRVGQSYVDLSSAVVGPAVSTVPYAPTIGTATRGYQKATVTWNAPANDGGVDISGYKIISDPAGHEGTAGPSATSGEVTGLTAGVSVSYRFRVKAFNNNGDGIFSNYSDYITPYTVPGAPASASAEAGWLAATVSWTEPTNDGGADISGYRIKNGATVVKSVGSDVSSADISGLTAGISYEFSVVAYNDASDGAAVTANTVVPYDIPDAPTITSVDAGNTEAIVHFTDASSNSSAISGYVIIATNTLTSADISVGNVQAVDNTLTMSSGLVNGIPYSFVIKATNAAGDSSASNSFGPVTLNAPPVDNVSIILASDLGEQGYFYVGREITTDIPTNPNALTDEDGISSDISYQWFDTNSGLIADATGPTFVLTRDQIGYHVGVVVSYMDGVGNSESVTVGNMTSDVEVTVPDAPTELDVSATIGSFVISWTAPARDGGADISGYQIYNGSTWLKDVDASSTSVTLGLADDLVIGDIYYINVRAVSVVGPSEFVGPITRMFVAVPAPFIRHAYPIMDNSDGQINIAWTINSIPSDIFARYEVFDASNNVLLKTILDQSGSYGGYADYIADISGGVSYTLKMRTIIEYAGDEYTSDFSADSEPVSAVDYPYPPTNIVTVGGDNEILITWDPPVYIGNTSVYKYLITYENTYIGGTSGNTLVTGDLSSCRLPMDTPFHIANGFNYKITITTITKYSKRVYSDETNYTTIEKEIHGDAVDATSSGVVYTLPVAPNTVIASDPSAGSAKITWGDSNNQVHSGIDKYTIYSDPSGATLDVSYSAISSWPASAIITGLQNGTEYTFRVAAHNPSGYSALSGASGGVTPRDVPEAPISIELTEVIENSGGAVLVDCVNGFDNGADITSYYVQAVDASTNAFVTDASGSVRPILVTGLTNGVAYKFRVYAINELGMGPYLESAEFIPYTYPGGVSDLSAVDGYGAVTLNWTVPADNGRPITKFVVYYGDVSYNVNAPAGGFSVGDPVSEPITLDPSSTLYSFTIRAYNAADLGPVSGPAEAQSYGKPDAPTGFVGAVGKERNDLSWNAPIYTGYLPIDHYLLDVAEDGVPTAPISISGDATTFAHTELTAGVTYTYYIRTVTLVQSDQAGPINKKPYTNPGAPAIGVASSSDGGMSVSWSAPAPAYNGEDISGYHIEIDQSGTGVVQTFDVSAAVQNITVSDLSNGYAYRARVAARNTYLMGDYSSWSNSVIPSSVPGAPTGLAATKGKNSINLSWTPPTNTGGLNVPIDSYIIYNAETDISLQEIAGTNTTVSGLADGTSYTFAVSAKNVRGEGAPSDDASAMTNSQPSGSITITGDFSQESVLTVVTTGLVDPDGLGEFSYQWMAEINANTYIDPNLETYTDANNDIFIDLSGETEDTLTVTQALVNRKIRVKVRYVDDNNVLEMTTSAATSAIANVNDPGTGLAINGTAAYGQDLSANTTNLSDPDGLSGEFSYQWWRNTGGATDPDTAINGATNAIYTVARADVNNKLRLTVSYTDAFGGANTVFSSYTAVVPKVPPTAVTLTGTLGNQLATLNWSLPEWNGGTTDVSYNVWRSYDGTDASGIRLAQITDLSYTQTGLTNGQTYYYFVVAETSAGVGSKSNVVSVKPGTNPTAVRDLSGSYTSQAVRLTWLGPSSNGGYSITSYDISGVGAGNTARATTTDLSYGFSGLTNGQAYTYAVKAQNELGLYGPTTNITVTPSTTPNPPTSVDVSAAYIAGSPSAIVRWQPSDSSGGAAIDYYEVRRTDISGSQGTTTGLTLTISGLTAMSTYRFVVYAHNKNGYSATAADPGYDITAFGLPGAPRGLTATYGNTMMTLNWQDASANGSPVDYYDISVGSIYRTTTAKTIDISGLTNGTNYRFFVRARNAAGFGSAADISGYPSTTPSAPTALTTIFGNGTIDLSWGLPASTGGDAISGYKIEYFGADLSGIQTKTLNTATSRYTTISSLTNGITYTFRVAAINRNVLRDGVYVYSSDISDYPCAVSSPPTGVTITGNGNRTLDLSWNAPASTNGAAVIDYYIYATGSATVRTTSTGLRKTVTDLSNGEQYTFTVKARNRAGLSEVSNTSNSEKPSAPPATPSTLATVATPSGVPNINHAAYENGATIYNSTNLNYYGPTPWQTSTPTNITTGWVADGLILNGTTNRNTTGRSTDKYTANATTWVNNSPGSPYYTVIDLGSERSFNKAYAYQTFQNGKTTQLSLAYAPTRSYATTDPSLNYTSSTWIPIFSNKALTNVNTGYNLEQIFNYVTTRYIRVAAVNDGTFADTSYVELYNIKLFYDASGLVLDGSDRSIPLTWSAPVNNGDAITGYTITWVGTDASGSYPAGATDTSYNITRLTNGIQYTVTITATNRDGPSAITTITSTPGRVPNAPTSLVTNGYGNQYVDLSWNDFDTSANSGRTLTGYTVYAYTNADLSGTPISMSPSPATSTSLRFTGLTNGTIYYFVVKGQNSLGYSAASNTITEFSRTTPTAPHLDVSHGDGTLIPMWDLSNNSGLPITKFTIYKDGVGTDISGDVSSNTYNTGLVNGTASTFYVVSYNALGDISSNTVTEYPSKKPDVPVAPTVTGYDISSISLSWPEGVSNGDPISRYTVYQSLSSGGTYTSISDLKKSISFVGATGVYSQYVRKTTTSAACALAGDFTIEMFIKCGPQTSNLYPLLMSKDATWGASNNYYINVDHNNSGKIGNINVTMASAPSYIAITGTKRVTDNTWHHIALVRSGTSLKLYIDGVLDATNTSSGTWDYSTLTIGGSLSDNNNNINYNGLLTNVRIMNAALYTGAFTPPSSALTAVANTVFLMNNNYDAPFYDSVTGVTLTAGGTNTPTVSSVTPFSVASTPTYSAGLYRITVGGLTTDTTYYHKITATNRDGETALSAASAAEKPSAKPSVPILRGIGHGDGSIDLSWNASTANGDAVTYYVYRTDVSGSFSEVEDWSGTALTYRRTGLTNGTTYYLKVRAYNRDGYLADSSVLYDYPSKVPDTPAAPTIDVSAHDLSGITIAWVAPADNSAAITKYSIYYNISGGAQQFVTDVSGSVRSYRHGGLIAGTIYYYKITATNRDGPSAFSAQSRGEYPSAKPSVPILRGIGHGDGSIDLSWNASTANGDPVRYYVYRTDVSGSFTEVEDWSGSALTYRRTGLTNGTTYYLKVRAYNRDGYLADSSVLYDYPSKAPEAPAAPTIDASAHDLSGITIAWVAPADNGAAITSYKLYFTNISGGSMTLITSVSGTTRSYRHGGLTPGKIYYYKIVAINRDSPANPTATDYSAQSRGEYPSAKPNTPAAPTIDVSAHDLSGITIAWVAPVDNSDNITSYSIYYNISGGSQQFLTDVSGSVRSYRHGGLTLGTTYYYAISATNRDGPSLISANSRGEYPSAKPDTPVAPTIDVSAHDLSGITIAWVAPADNGAAITSYKLYYTNVSGGTVTLITSVSGSTRTYRHGGLPPGTTYYYKIVAINRDSPANPTATDYSAQSRGEYPSDKPSAASTPIVRGHGDGYIDLSWNTSTSNGDTVVYTLYQSSDGANFTTVAWSGTATSHRVTDLSNGITYSFKLKASNRDGDRGLSGSSIGEYPSKKPELPAAPTIVGHSVNSIDISWGPVVNNGATIITYRLYTSSVEAGPYTFLVDLSGTTYTYTHTGLIKGQTYYYTMAAENRDGWTEQSAPSEVERPSTNPGEPTIDISGYGDHMVRVVWEAPTDNGGSALTAYRIYNNADDSLIEEVSGDILEYEHVDMDISNGVYRAYYVKAVNRDGESVKSNIDGEYASRVPDAPVLDISDYGFQFIELKWAAPYNGGDTITEYKLWDGSTNEVITTTNATTFAYKHEGLASDARRYYYITAKNRDGYSAPSAMVDEVPSMKSDPPTDLSLNNQPEAFWLNWQPPMNTGGSPINYYSIINADTGSLIKTVTDISATITGLEYGKTYRFIVTVNTRDGDSLPSSPSNSAMFVGRPQPPRILVAIPGDSVAQLTFRPPFNTGGPRFEDIVYRAYTPDGVYEFTTAAMTLYGCTILGLINGQSYQFVLKTYNGYFESTLATAPSAAITPASVADMPTGQKYTEVDANNTVYVGKVVEHDPTVSNTIIYNPPDPYVYSKAIIEGVPPTLDVTRAEVSVTPVESDAETNDKIVIVRVRLYNSSGERVSNLGQVVTVYVEIPNIGGDKEIAVYVREDETEEFVFMTMATHVSGNTYKYETTHFTDNGIFITNKVPCIVAGTKVLTANGYKKVEDLVSTDRLVTSEGRSVPFVRMSTTVAKATEASAPYRIPAHCFGRNFPPAPVTLSGRHAIQIKRGVWHFPVALANIYSGIKQVNIGETVTYYHIRLPNYLRDNMVVNGGAILESLGGNKYADAAKIYTYSARLGGFTRVSASQFDRIHHA